MNPFKAVAPAIPELEKIGKMPNGSDAIILLDVIGPEAVPALNKALADADNTVSQIAAEALKQIQQP